MSHFAWRAAAVAAGLAFAAGAPGAAHGAQGEDAAMQAPPTALRSTVFQRSRSTPSLGADAQAMSLPHRSSRSIVAASAGESVLQDLARGTLLRARLDDDADLTLRLRGHRLGLYLVVRLPDGF